MTLEEKVVVVKAAHEGRWIQWREKSPPFAGPWEWADATQPDILNFNRYDYRVKPEPPKPREFWIHIDPVSKTTHLVNAVPGDDPETCPNCIRVREVLPE